MKQGSTFVAYRGRLYVGTWDAALNNSFLMMYHIGLVINCSDRPTEKKYSRPSYSLNVNFVGADYRQEPAASLVDRAAEADNLIANTFQQRKSVLCHCLRAVHRSIAYASIQIAQRKRISLGAAHTEVVRSRWKRERSIGDRTVRESWMCTKELRRNLNRSDLPFGRERALLLVT